MKKVMFNDKLGLTQAVLDGRKTQTRRIVSQSLIDKYEEWYDDVCSIAMPSGSTIETLRDWLLRKHTRYRVGEVVAVAQSYKDVNAYYSAAYQRRHSIHGMTVDELDCVPDEDIKKWFKIRDEFKDKASWNNKMFVKPEYMHHQIRITDFRVEKLQGISEKDAISEGITCAGLTHEDYGEPIFIIEGCKQTFGSARDAYAWLIDKISGKGTWQSNPYVFVYDFELVK